ncbi:MAG: hypothetical protein AABY22_37120, partial [Nanoarchaeota archaeon]
MVHLTPETIIEINKKYVSFEIAKKLKEIGFNEPCMAYYRYLGEYSKEILFHERVISQPFDFNCTHGSIPFF